MRKRLALLLVALSVVALTVAVLLPTSAFAAAPKFSAGNLSDGICSVSVR